MGAETEMRISVKLEEVEAEKMPHGACVFVGKGDPFTGEREKGTGDNPDGKVLVLKVGRHGFDPQNSIRQEH